MEPLQKKGAGFQDGMHTFPQEILQTLMSDALRDMKVDAISDHVVVELKKNQDPSNVSARKIYVVVSFHS